MGPSTEMPTRKGDYKVLSARVDPDWHSKVMSAVKGAGGTMDRFLRDAVEEKLGRGSVEMTDVGPFRDLSATDRALVEDLADMLRQYPDDQLLREIIDAHRIALWAVVRRHNI